MYVRIPENLKSSILTALSGYIRELTTDTDDRWKEAQYDQKDSCISYEEFINECQAINEQRQLLAQLMNLRNEWKRQWNERKEDCKRGYDDERTRSGI